jgi:8-oxo-dGTP pyrophosphatase MutT (NUDIX family)
MELAEKYSIIPFDRSHINNIREDLVGKIRVEKIVTMNEIKQVQAGYGSSRIGLVVLLGTSRNYLFNTSNRGLYSDFGGGISKKETLYDGMIREVSEEIPFWADYFLKCTEAKGVKCHVVETLHVDKPELNRIEALVFITIDDYGFQYMPPFEPTKEVENIFYVPEIHIKDWLEITDNALLNTGLMQYKKYLSGRL